jgi:hypothetical protein
MKKAKYAVGDLVMVNWRDAAGASGWMSEEDITDWIPPDVQTVGWVIVVDKRYIVVCDTISDGHQQHSRFAGTTAIPLSWAETVIILKRKDKKI